MSEEDKFKTVRISLEKMVTLSKRSVDGTTFLLGGLSEIHWSEFQLIVQGVINLICKQLRINPESVLVEDAVPVEAGRVQPEIHIEPQVTMEPEETEEFSCALYAFLVLLKDPAWQFDDDLVSQNFPHALQHARDEAEQVVALSGGRRLPCALQIRGTALKGTLKFEGQIRKGEELESESEPFKIEGDPDGFCITKHFMHFKVRSSEIDLGQRSGPVYFDENVWGPQILSMDYINIRGTEITVVRKKKGSREWLKLTGMDL